MKTMGERHVYGGFANTALDPCYHAACDTVENINTEVLGQMARSAAYTLQQLATNPSLRFDMGRPKTF